MNFKNRRKNVTQGPLCQLNVTISLNGRTIETVTLFGTYLRVKS